jgi:phosphohistidine phosphatase
MPTLIIMRHAKAVDRMEAEDDFERGLTERGKDDAAKTGEAIGAAGLRAGLALVSPSRRTRETWDRMAPAFPGPVPVSVIPALYDATPATMLGVLRDAGPGCVLMLGHSPGIGALARALAANVPDDPDFARYPTCAATVFAFGPGDWADVTPGTGRIDGFTVPRRLGM